MQDVQNNKLKSIIASLFNVFTRKLPKWECRDNKSNQKVKKKNNTAIEIIIINEDTKLTHRNQLSSN